MFSCHSFPINEKERKNREYEQIRKAVDGMGYKNATKRKEIVIVVVAKPNVTECSEE